MLWKAFRKVVVSSYHMYMYHSVLSKHPWVLAMELTGQDSGVGAYTVESFACIHKYT